MAELIRAWGEEFTPAGARSPILDRSIMAKVPETWTVPVAIDFNDFDLDDELKARLELWGTLVPGKRTGEERLFTSELPFFIRGSGRLCL